MGCATYLLIPQNAPPGSNGMESFWAAAKMYYIIPLVLDLYLLIVLVSVGPLCCFHMYLVATAQTTREVFKDNSGNTGSRNPYSHGIFHNFYDTCCKITNPFPQSLTEFQVPISSSRSGAASEMPENEGSPTAAIRLPLSLDQAHLGMQQSDGLNSQSPA
mmetsp:Transcript_43638/g.78512  ORF Transcript_43638/g.78512 Transcript_43638/m.78512 type:complete len:160 (+) Transcript_43638:177-656(+)